MSQLTSLPACADTLGLHLFAGMLLAAALLLLAWLTRGGENK